MHSELPTPEEISQLPSDGGPRFNRLIFESSPYLLQHARNPINWRAWGEEALELAVAEDKPIFLSIGYTTCHWCHVMERESFEDDEVAHLLNEHFISIKVDREERPDLDHVYMAVTQMMTGRGGWPMTVILTPQKVPFFAGTYFPKASMLDLLPHFSRVWKEERERSGKSDGPSFIIYPRPRKTRREETLMPPTWSAVLKLSLLLMIPSMVGLVSNPSSPPPMPSPFCFATTSERVSRKL